MFKKHYLNQNLTGIELNLKSGERIILGNAQNGVKLCKLYFGFFPKTVWMSTNTDRIEEVLGPENGEYFSQEPLEVFALNLKEKFESILELQRKF